MSQRFVPVGGQVRVNVAVLTDLPEGERFKDFWWATDGVSVVIKYTDSNAKQRMRTKAVITQFATKGPLVTEMAVFQDRKWRKPRRVALGRGSH